jgi:proline iminopeptidase
MVRGYSKDNPVLLYLSGGPGQSDLPYVRVLFDDLSRYFVVVGWDQRGTGKSYRAFDPVATMTPEQAVADTNELATYLSRRFGKRKIYLLGESWGTILGVLAVKRHPELYHAFIGSGQMVSPRETDRGIYRDELALATRTGDRRFADRLRAQGEPPYADVPYGNALMMGHYEQLYAPYTPPQAYRERGQRAVLGPFGVLGSEYDLVEKVNVLRGLLDTFSVMYPKLQSIDFRRDVKHLELPVYMLDGAAEIRSRRSLAREWFDHLEAPAKRRFSFENAAHSVVFEQFQAFEGIMRDTIVPETSP